MVSERPARCAMAPPALIAASAKARVPGAVLRVQATTTSGEALRAASTMARAPVATPDQISISVCAVFQARSSAVAGPLALRMGSPGRSAAPVAQESETSPPAISISPAASSTSAAIMGPRAAKRIAPAAFPSDRVSLVRSPKGASSKSSRSSSVRLTITAILLWIASLAARAARGLLRAPAGRGKKGASHGDATHASLRA